MVDDLKPATLRLFMWVGVADLVVGIGLAVALVLGLFGPGMEAAAVVPTLFAFGGIAIFAWARHKLSQFENRRGDMN